MGKGAATAAEQPEVIVGQPTWIERGVPGRHGEVRVREYTPAGEPSGPRLVWVHGGGWVVGTLSEPEAHAVGMAVAAAGFPVTSVEYGLVPMFSAVGPLRLKPSPFRYPVTQDQVMDAWLDAQPTPRRCDVAGWCVRRCLPGGRRSRCGCATVRGRPSGSAWPSCTGCSTACCPTRRWPLRRRLFGLSDLRVVQEMVRRAAVNHAGSADLLTTRTIFPGLGDLTGLPPVHLLNADRDMLRASAENFAHRLTQAEVPHEGWYLPGTTHGFLARPEQPPFTAGIAAMTGWLAGSSTT